MSNKDTSMKFPAVKNFIHSLREKKGSEEKAINFINESLFKARKEAEELEALYREKKEDGRGN